MLLACFAVTLPDGSVKEGVLGVTSPMEIAAGISKSLAKKVLVSRRAALAATGHSDTLWPS